MFPPQTRILIADDMPTIRYLVKKVLESLDYKNITEASDGEEAFQLMLQRVGTRDPFELVISDWSMPKVNGLELLKRIRSSQDWVNLPFILLTAENDRDQVTEAILAGVSQYIIKPFNADSLREKLKGAWARHTDPTKQVK